MLAAKTSFQRFFGEGEITVTQSPPDDLAPDIRRVFDAVALKAHLLPEAISEAKIQVLAPELTGRLDITADDVDPQEKSYAGKRAEVFFLAAAGFPRAKAEGRPLDTVIAGEDVEVKTSMTGTVMIAQKDIGQIVLIILHNPKKDTWSIGVVRATKDLLNPGRGPVETESSLGAKGTLSKAGRAAIRWIVHEELMPPDLRNPLTALPAATARAILSERSGQAKLDALFSVCLDTPIPRWIVAVLGQQADPSKRVRDVRIHLKPQGIRVLSTRYDRAELVRLGLNPPESAGFFFSTRR
jgi:hypothetical protein